MGNPRLTLTIAHLRLLLFAALGNLFVDVYGQHEHQSLMRLDMQRQLLDGFAGQQ